MLQEFNLPLKCIRTSRRQTAVAAATAGYSVEQEPLTRPLTSAAQPSPPPLADPLYLKTTVRSGTTVRHTGTVIILGDINPGGEVIAGGDILIWGSLRGIAHAGASGNRECCIMALRMEPTQLRLADSIARVPATGPELWEPEVAYLTKEGIRLSSAINFLKNQRIMNYEL
jgi:septum site-determining protein MinC